MREQRSLPKIDSLDLAAFVVAEYTQNRYSRPVGRRFTSQLGGGVRCVSRAPRFDVVVDARCARLRISLGVAPGVQLPNERLVYCDDFDSFYHGRVHLTILLVQLHTNCNVFVR